MIEPTAAPAIVPPAPRNEAPSADVTDAAASAPTRVVEMPSFFVGAGGSRACVVAAGAGAGPGAVGEVCGAGPVGVVGPWIPRSAVESPVSAGRVIRGRQLPFVS